MKLKFFISLAIISSSFIYVNAQLKLHQSGGLSFGSTTDPGASIAKFHSSVEIVSGLSTNGDVDFGGLFHLNTSGTVGIGTETPTNIGGFEKVLDVHGTNSALLSANTSDGITTSLMSSTYSDWGGVGTQSNHYFHIKANNSTRILVKPSGEVNIIEYIRLGSYNNKITLSTTGSYGSASSFDFNSSSSNRGIIMEQGVSESSGFYSDGDFAVIWSPGDQDRLLRVYDEDGMVEKWYLDASGVAHTASDLRRKENIKEIRSAASKLYDIRGVSYNYKAEDHTSTDNIRASMSSDESSEPFESEIDSLSIIKEGINDTEKTQPSEEEYFGFVAQEVEAIFPELVSTDEDGNRFISYMEFIPLIVEVLKEQQTQIEDLEQIIASSSGTLKGAITTSTSFNEVIEDAEMTSLFQNRPNPFSVETTISYYLSENTRSASLFVYDMTGKQLKSFKTSQRGSGEVVIYGGELDAGLYMYSLVADGQLIETKQMVLTD